jgi:CRP/FNR family cyclic AMP-dependent transcriptional regulator
MAWTDLLRVQPLTANKTILLKSGQILFKQGDPSNGMYLVRKGLFVIYLQKEDKGEVELARVSAGGIIGEMALFDQKPRSASVRALEDSEASLISPEDFATLMKQIPKWFASLMTTLSGRLRSTNERLEKIQSQTAPAMNGIRSVLRVLFVVDLLFYKNAEKEGKEWFLDAKSTQDNLSINFAEDPKRMGKLVLAFDQVQLFKLKKNSYNALCLSTPNRGNLTKFVEFLGSYLQSHPDSPALPKAALDILKALKTLSEESAYEVLSTPLGELIAYGKKIKSPTVEDWSKQIGLLRNIHPDITLNKISSDAIGIRYDKKALKEMLSYHEILSSLVVYIENAL